MLRSRLLPLGSVPLARVAGSHTSVPSARYGASFILSVLIFNCLSGSTSARNPLNIFANLSLKSNKGEICVLLSHVAKDTKAL